MTAKHEPELIGKNLQETIPECEAIMDSKVGPRTNGHIMTKEPLHIGALIYPEVDQAYVTGPLEVLREFRIPAFMFIAKDRSPIRDVRGLILTPEITLQECPGLNVSLVPGGAGQEGVREPWRSLSSSHVGGGP